MNTKRERPGLVILFFAIIVIATWASMLMSSLSYNRSIGGQPDIMSHYPATFDKLVEAFGDDLLPTWMPDGLELKKIYLRGNKTGALAYLAYSDREISHYLEAKIILTLKKPYSIGPNPDNPNLVKVGDILVSARDSPTTSDSILYFYHNSTYYLFTTSAYRKDTLIKIVENMRTMKGQGVGQNSEK